MTFAEFIAEALRRMGLYDRQVQINCLKALSASLTLDLADPDKPRPFSPDQINDVFGIPTDEQSHFRISVKRNEAEPFMRHLGLRRTKSDLVRNLQARKYLDFFGRKVSKCGNRKGTSATIYTYAEIAQRFGIRRQPDIPEILTQAFDEFGIPFPYPQPSGKD